MPAKKNTRYSVSRIKTVVSQLNELTDKEDTREKLRDIVDQLGGKIAVASTDTDESLHVDSEGFTIFISPVTSPLRDNFTIAHELGHLLLHTDPQANERESVTFGRYGNGTPETEANRFAAELLMPEEKFLNAAKEYDDDPRMLAREFGVSPAAAAVRIESLKK